MYWCVVVGKGFTRSRVQSLRVEAVYIYREEFERKRRVLVRNSSI